MQEVLSRLDAMESAMSTAFARVDAGLGGVNLRLDRVNGQIDRHRDALSDHRSLIHGLQRRLGELAHGAAAMLREGDQPLRKRDLWVVAGTIGCLGALITFGIGIATFVLMANRA